MVIVVGHTGRVGKFLYDAYKAAGFKAIGIGRGFEYSLDNAALINGLLDPGPHCVVYTALSSDRPYTALQSERDLKSLARFLEWVQALHTRPSLVFLSSISVYENLPSGLANTRIALACESPYARMKLDSENLITAARSSFESVCILRCGALLVHPSVDESFLGGLILNLRNQQVCELKNKHNRFNALITAADLFGILINPAAMSLYENTVSLLNIGSTEPLSMGDVAENAAKALQVANCVTWSRNESLPERILEYPTSLAAHLPTVRQSLRNYISKL